MSERIQSETFPLSRRIFLLSSGALAIALAIPDAAEAANGAASKPPLSPDQLDSYLAIEPDGTVTVFYGRIDGALLLAGGFAMGLAYTIVAAVAMWQMWRPAPGGVR